MNGDGIDDLIVGAPHGDDGGTNAGEAYVIYGRTETTRGTLDLSTLTAAHGFIIQGDLSNDETGFSVSSAGDVNGDGIDDLIVGAPRGDDGGTDAGEAYVIYGSLTIGQPTRYSPFGEQDDQCSGCERFDHRHDQSRRHERTKPSDRQGLVPGHLAGWHDLHLRRLGQCQHHRQPRLDRDAALPGQHNRGHPTRRGRNSGLTFTAPSTGATTYYLAVGAPRRHRRLDGRAGDYRETTLTDNGPGVAANNTPIATAINTSAAVGTSIALTDLFTFRDLDGAGDITHFAVQDRTPGGGDLTFNGVVQASNTLFERPIAELSQWRFVVGSGTDQIGFNAIDQAGAFNQSVAATVTPLQIAPPPLSAEELFDRSGGQITALATFASAAYERYDESMSELQSLGWNFLNGSNGLPGFSGDYYRNSFVIAPQAGIATAILAESPDGNSLVISFRGTDSFYTIDGALDWLNNLTGITQHYALFDDLLTSIDFSQYDHIYVTGHSLGAAMAQTLMLDPRFGLSDDPRAESVTFANPGSVISPFQYSNDRMVNIAIEGDPVAELGQLGRVAGDRYLLDHTLPSSSDWHGMEWYLAGARYIDASTFSDTIEQQSENGTRDIQELRVRLDVVNGTPWIGTLPQGSVITPTEIVFGLDPGTIRLSDTWSASVTPSVAGGTPAVVFSAPDIQTQSLS